MQRTPDTATETAVGHLERLAVAITDGQELKAEVIQRGGGPPFLRVTNPEAARLAENVTAAVVDGSWHYWWSWAEPIASVGEVAEAARLIGYVLTPADGEL